MKQKERKEAELDGDILFASYSMAKEALDIERLNTIIFATPQKNVIQAMGRIMRKNSKDTGIRPLIIDFIDEIRSFSRHYERRKKIYDKCLYKIYNYYLQKNKIISKSENEKIKFGHDVKFEDEYERDWNFIFKEDEDNEDDENKDTNKIEIVNTYKYNKDDFKEYLFDT
jgi:superfamily II DNA or RNA helicase